MVPFESLGTVSYSHSVIVDLSYIIPRYLQKIMIFLISPFHLMPQLGGPVQYYYHTVWCGKTRMVWLSDGEKVDTFSHFNRIPARDGQTSCGSIVHAVHSITQ